MFCLKCGSEISNEDKYCSKCGNEISAINNNSCNTKRIIGKKCIIMLIFFLILLGLIIIVFLKNKANKNEASKLNTEVKVNETYSEENNIQEYQNKKTDMD